MCLQSLEGFVLYDMLASVVFHIVSCCFRMSSDISLLRLCNLFMTSGVGVRRLRWLRVLSLSLISLLRPGL